MGGGQTLNGSRGGSSISQWEIPNPVTGGYSGETYESARIDEGYSGIESKGIRGPDQRTWGGDEGNGGDQSIARVNRIDRICNKRIIKE